ncbi:MAG: hypothetical protein HYS44_03905 [Candidatus Niyogibacteria bacterium]|nr:hypothetical protein [Candidatus Niyogibacteria bacterium]
MTLLDSIERLQQKPRTVRLRVLAISVASIMGVILVVWAANLKATLHPSEQTFDDSIRPFTVLGDIVRNNVESAKSQLSGLPKKFPF